MPRNLGICNQVVVRPSDEKTAFSGYRKIPITDRTVTSCQLLEASTKSLDAGNSD